METSASEGKRRLKHQVLGDEEETDEDESAEDLAFEDDRSKKVSSSRRGSFGGGASSPPSCQVDNCTADLTYSKTYHKRHKVCEFHAKAPIASITGFQQRFCQQCSRFHALQEFDDTKRSCRRRLAGHNERRRKSSYESQGDGSS